MVHLIKDKGKIQTLREGSFQIHGGKLFNSLPKPIRNLSRVNIQILRYWNIDILRYWNIEILENIGILRIWNIEILGYSDIRIFRY